MKQYTKFKKAFGVNEFGLIDFPTKISNIRISRIKNFEKMGGCLYCFPHGVECTNSREHKFTRNWKHYREFQYKVL